MLPKEEHRAWHMVEKQYFYFLKLKPNTRKIINLDYTKLGEEESSSVKQNCSFIQVSSKTGIIPPTPSPRLFELVKHSSFFFTLIKST